MTDAETIRMHAAQGLTRAVHPEAKRHFRAILEVVDGEALPSQLAQCPDCGKVGLPERVEGGHDCAPR